MFVNGSWNNKVSLKGLSQDKYIESKYIFFTEGEKVKAIFCLNFRSFSL